MFNLKILIKFKREKKKKNKKKKNKKINTWKKRHNMNQIYNTLTNEKIGRILQNL